MSQKLKQDMNIGNNIKVFRSNSNLTQEEVVAKLQLLGIDMSRSIYSQIERGTYNIRISELFALKEIFQVSMEDFFKGIQL